MILRKKKKKSIILTKMHEQNVTNKGTTTTRIPQKTVDDFRCCSTCDTSCVAHVITKPVNSLFR